MRGSEPVAIPQTFRAAWPGATPAAELGDADVLVTAWLRPRRGGKVDVERATQLGATLPAERQYVDRGELLAKTSADAGDVDVLRRYCVRFGIEAVATHWRAVTLAGSIRDFVKAFGATAGICELADKRRFRHRYGSLHAPPEIAEMVQGVFGIEQWPRSHAIGHIQPKATPPSVGDTIARYAFPDGDGSGQTVAIVQLRGEFKPEDFMLCMQRQGVSAKTPIVKRVDNAELKHAVETAKDLESAIDTQVVAEHAPGAQIVVYAAPDDERGLLDAMRSAIFDEESRPSILSVSIGLAEHVWTPGALAVADELLTTAALAGVSVFCASGDNGAELDASGAAHVLAPASSPFAHACGGTQIADDTGEEIAWPRTGGGFSERFRVPPWQGDAAAVADGYGVRVGRGVPDVSADAMPGYCVYVEGTQFAMGGTSAVAPLWAALSARVAQRLGHALGFFAPLLYDAHGRSAFRAITSGGNDRFQSAAGWNPCTGLGVPIGTALESMLSAKRS